MITLSKQTVRRFIMGRQGLWPGRRWVGREGVAQAVRTMEALQLDPLNVVARSHDIALWGRVLDYQPAYLDEWMYQERAFFDYGGGLFIYPMSELPYWRWHMQRQGEDGRWVKFAAANPDLLDTVRAELRARGPLGNRDFEGTKRVESYRGRKDTSLALYTLWITGELLIHHRDGFERIYDFRENVAPPELLYTASEAESKAYFARKAVAFAGLCREQGWRVTVADYLNQPLDKPTARRWLEQLLADGTFIEVIIAGDKERRFALADDLPLLQTLAEGNVPESWRPQATTTDEEMVFLAPLEIVSARGRAKWVFDFDYVWEVYKPAEKRRWGYYTLPVLYGDRLVARFDPRLDRAQKTLMINGFWLEDAAAADDPAFVQAWVRGLARFATFVGAEQVNLQGMGVMRPQTEAFIKETDGLLAASRWPLAV